MEEAHFGAAAMIRGAIAALSTAVFATACTADACEVGMRESTIRIAPEEAIGPVKPVNGVGQPPMVGALRGWDMFHYLSEAGIPYSRLHDVGGWLGGGLAFIVVVK